MPDPIQRYAGRIPEEVESAIEGLSSELERAVFVALHDEGDLAFTQLQELLGPDDDRLHQMKLSTALKNLTKGGLIRKRVGDTLEDEPFEAYYSVSEYGFRFLNAMFDTLGLAEGPGGRRRPLIQFKQETYDSIGEMRGELALRIPSDV